MKKINFGVLMLEIILLIFDKVYWFGFIKKGNEDEIFCFLFFILIYINMYYVIEFIFNILDKKDMGIFKY